MRLPPSAAFALLHASSTTLPQRCTTTWLSAAATSPLFDFSGADAQASLDAWERIDDVIMGGVSNSRLVLDSGKASFEGRIRSEGGGFCGTRMRLLKEPIDLSSSEGMYVEAELPKDGIDPSKRVWKMAVRTKQDRGEVVYQQAFTPPPAGGGRQIIRLPFDGFRLVRGPRLVPGVPPLTPQQTNETYQVSIVVSKFTVSEDGSALPAFEEGPFALKLFSVGTFGGAATAAATSATTVVPKPLSEAEQRAAASPMIKLLRPLLGLLFGESNRRRAAATKLLEARGSGAIARAKLGWGWRAATYGQLGALQRTSAVMLQTWSAAALALPIRLLFKVVFLMARSVKRVQRVIKGEPEPIKLPPLA